MHATDKSDKVKWSGRNEGGITGVRMFTRFSLVTGPWLGPVLLAIFVPFFIPFLKTRRAGSELFYTQLRGRRVSWLRRLWDTYRQFLAFVLCWHERNYAFVNGTRFLDLRVTGDDHIARARAAGRPVILLTAHMSNFELGAWILAQQSPPALAGAPPVVNMVMIETEVEAVRAYIATLKGAVQPKIIAVNSSPLSSLAILAALRRGEIVCMQGDRATGSHAAQVPFLGRPAPFPLGPYQLAKLSNAAVIPTFCRRLGRARYAFELYAPLETGDEAAAAERYAQILEREARARPTYWFNLFSFWDDAHAPHVPDAIRAAS
jgi:lauroyl/myristoyl acyltransferase